MPRTPERIPQVPGAPAGTYPSPTQGLVKKKTQPIRTPKSDAYGHNVQLEAAQKAAPLPDAASAPMAPLPEAQLQAAAAVPFPGSGQGILEQPTQRPTEPIQTGLPTGPGAGPEILHPALQSPVAAVLNAIANATGDRDIANLAGLAAHENA